MQATMLRASTSVVSGRMSASRPMLPGRPIRGAMLVRAAADNKDSGYYPLDNKGVGVSGVNVTSTTTSSSTPQVPGVRPIAVTEVKEAKTVSVTGGGGGTSGGSNFGKGGGGGGSGGVPEPAGDNGGKQIWDTIKLVLGISAILYGINFLYQKFSKPPSTEKVVADKAAHVEKSVRKGADDVKGQAKKAEKDAENLVQRGLHSAERTVERGVDAVRHGGESVQHKASDLIHHGQHEAKKDAEQAKASAGGLFDGVKNAVSDVAHKVSGTADQASSNVKGAAKNASKQAKKAGDKIGQAASDAEKKFPYKTVGTVGAIGAATLGAAAAIGTTALYFMDKAKKSSGTTGTGTSRVTASKPAKTTKKTVEVKTEVPVNKAGDTVPAEQVKATVTAK